MLIRPRRNRRTANLREMVAETTLSAKDLIAPLFVIDGKNKREEISSMPGQARLSVDLLLKEVETLAELGVPCVSLFPALEDSLKNKEATESWNPKNLYQQAIRALKKEFPEVLVMSDVALDPYSSDGHDGWVDPQTGEIVNDKTLEILAKMAVCQGESGADIVGPSDMMDGRVECIREALDAAGLLDTAIMSYTAKYCSSFYGPFREALDSAPRGGDKKTYQMDFRNVREALRETELDEAEGADIVMVKPGLPYLDVVSAVRKNTPLPVAVYNVSGEYAMVKAAAEKGWLDGDKVMMEMLMSFKRAGADMILTYFAKEAAQALKA
jgi:porphobilinogen synthase